MRGRDRSTTTGGRVIGRRGSGGETRDRATEGGRRRRQRQGALGYFLCRCVRERLLQRMERRALATRRPNDDRRAPSRRRPTSTTLEPFRVRNANADECAPSSPRWTPVLSPSQWNTSPSLATQTDFGWTVIPPLGTSWTWMDPDGRDTSEPRTANREPQTANRKPRTANRDPRTAGLGSGSKPHCKTS